ncbi:MAG: argininosuccinate synthase [Elusimicrobia bacterium]|nr:MAG: argininosuccinate synthase [Elusimicrobiota bacterium]
MKKKILLAFSGGLDTSFCAIWLQKEKNADVVTAVVDTGGFSKEELMDIQDHALALGAIEHHTLDSKKEVFDRFVVTLIQGNVLRGKAYPLSVAAERVVQAEAIAKLAKEIGADAVCHGSTGVGNDQIRFDGAFHSLLPGIEVLTPIRELGLSRKQETEYLEKNGVKISSKTTDYSVNAGLWGTTIGGKETHDAWVEVPDAAYPTSGITVEEKGRELIIGFKQGVPVSLDGEALAGVELVGALHKIGKGYGVGRGIHVGDTILGIKGRIAFEAPAPLVLISAHRELEKIVLTRWQSFWKDHLADFYGQHLHEGLAYDPVMDDITAMISSSQKKVTGEARVRFAPGKFAVVGVRSDHSLLDAQDAAYGETASLWTGAEAAGFSKLHAMPMVLAKRAEAKA